MSLEHDLYLLLFLRNELLRKSSYYFSEIKITHHVQSKYSSDTHVFLYVCLSYVVGQYS